MSEAAELTQLKRALLALKEMRARLDAVEKARTEPIAIIGMGCRFPGGANSPDDFWQLLTQGTDAVIEVPPSRWDSEALYASNPETPGKINTRHGAFLDDVDQFDPYFFGISPHEAQFMDPQQRLLLEVAWEALENAGQTRAGLAGSDTAVFVGAHSHSQDYYWMQLANPDGLAPYTGTGTAHNVLAGRLSYLFDWQGPSIVIDTACSSSLVALHEACQSLRLGETSLALAAGVNIILTPQFSIAAAKMHMLAPDGRCKAFDAAADGFGRGEGCGVLVLKRLSDAIADGDPIVATVRGSAVNQDGNTNGLTAPNGLSQQRVIRQALANARVDPAQISFVETHGTGTVLGDPIEIEALTAVLGSNDERAPCYLGSAKANVAHLEGAAGIAGVIKAALTLQHRQIPELVHFQKPNPHLALDKTPFLIPRSLTRLPQRETPHLAGVSSFGWSGTNAHVILEEAPAATTIEAVKPKPTTYLLPLSAHTPQALRETAAAFHGFLQQSDAGLYNIGYTAATRRTHHAHRLVAIGASREEMAAQLAAFLQGEERAGLLNGRAPADNVTGLVFVFPGQGSQWLGMGRELLDSEPVFRRAIERCEAALQPFVDWSLTDELSAAAADSRLDRIDVIQPTLFAIQVALAELWRAWGIEPDAVIGHSMGEAAAAYVGGALSLADAARVICQRSRLMRRVSGQGTMAVVGLSLADTAVYLSGYEKQLSIAVSNSPRSTVVSGDPEALDMLLATLEADGVFCRRIKVDVASHSPQMDPLQTELETSLQAIRPQASQIPVYSTVTGNIISGESLTTAYWADNLRQPVLFSDTVQKAIESDHLTFVEISPHPILLTAVGETLHHVGREGLAVHSLKRDEPELPQMLAGLGALHAAGYRPDWHALYPEGGQFVPLPGLPWQHERYWLPTEGNGATAVGHWQAHQEAHPLLGWRLETAVDDRTTWQVKINAHLHPYLFAQRWLERGVLPPAALLEMSRAALTVHYDTPLPALTDVTFMESVPLPADGLDRQLQITIDGRAGGERVLIYHLHEKGWRLALQGNMHHKQLPAEAFHNLKIAESDTSATTSSDALYQQAITKYTDNQLFHTLDSCLQIVAASGYDEPSRIDALHFPAADDAAALCYARPNEDGLGYDVIVLDNEKQPLGLLHGLSLQKSVHAIPQNPAEWLYEMQWTPFSPAEETAVSGTWIIFSDRQGFGQALATHLQTKGDRAILVTPGDNFERLDTFHFTLPLTASTAPLFAALLEDSHSPIRGIIHCHSLDMPNNDILTPETLLASQEMSSAHALKLIQEMARTTWQDRPLLWLVTQAAQPIASDNALNLAQTPLWGLGRVIAEEHPEFWGGLIDLEAQTPPADTTASVAAIVSHAENEDQFAVRQSQLYVPRLAAVAADERRQTAVSWRADASYLITGGLGGVGYATAQWLARRGARRLVLMGRTPLPPRREWSQVSPETSVGRRIARILELEQLGTAVHYAAVDVANETQLRSWLNAFTQEHWPPIRGVFHAAVAIDDQLLINLDSDALMKVLRPKVVGGWLLHKLLPDLDYFIAYSSLGAIWGQPGQGNYAAANTFLDGLANYRQMQGMHGLSVNWGAWTGLGLASSPGAQRTIDELKAQGIDGFSAEKGLLAQNILLSIDAPQAAVIPVNWQRYQKAQADWSRQQRPFLKDILAKSQSDESDQSENGDGSHTYRHQLAQAEVTQRREILETYLQKRVADILKMKPEQINRDAQLGNFGFDSLMAIKLRNRLEHDLSLTLSATLVWNYPTIHEMAQFLARKMDIALQDGENVREVEQKTSDSTAAGAAEIDDIANEVESLSDEEALNALLNG